MEPIEYVRALIRRWPIIAIGALIGAAFAFVGTDPEPEPIRSTYTATHTLLVTEGQNQFGGQPLVGTVTFAQVPVFATTGEVPRLVAEELGYDGAPASLAAELTVEDDAQTGTLRFTTEQENAEDAVRIADAFADETVRYLSLRQEELHQARQTNVLEDVEQLEAEIRDLDRQIAEQLAELNANRPPGAPFAEADSITRARRDAAVREYSTAYEAYRSLVAEDAGTLNLTTLERAQPVQVQSGGFTPPRTRASRVPIAAAIGALLGAARRAAGRAARRQDPRSAQGGGGVRCRRRRRAAHARRASSGRPGSSSARRSTTPRPRPSARCGRRSRSWLPVGNHSPTTIGWVRSSSPHRARPRARRRSPSTSPPPSPRRVAASSSSTPTSGGRSPRRSSTDERPPLPAALDGIDRLDPSAFLVPTKVPGVQLLDLSPLGGTPG